MGGFGSGGFSPRRGLGGGFAGASQPFNPLSIAWNVYVDATTLVGSDGTSLATVSNLGSGAGFSQPTAGNRPTIQTVAGKKVIHFDGVDDFMTADAAFGAWATWTFYTLARDINTGASYVVDSSAAGAGLNSIIRGYTPNWEYFQTPRTVLAAINITNLQMIKNTAGTMLNNPWNLCALNGGVPFWGGDIRILAAKQGVLTAAEMASFEAYLATKL